MFIFLPIFASNKIYLQERYCIKNSSLTLNDLLKSHGNKQNIVIYKVPHNLSKYKIPSVDIIGILRKYTDKNVVDNPKHIILLDKQCFVDYKKESLKKAIQAKFKNRYKDMLIKDIKVEPINVLPPNLDRYSLKEIQISKQSLRRDIGNFLAIYHDKIGKKSKRVYFRYKIDAKIPLFKAKHNITNGKILSRNNIKKVYVKFTKIPMGYADDFKDGEFFSKSFIKKGEILTYYKIRRKTLINKNDIVRAIIRDGSLVLEFFATALKDANKGDFLKIRGKNNKIYKAIAIKKGVVEIQ